MRKLICIIFIIILTGCEATKADNNNIIAINEFGEPVNQTVEEHPVFEQQEYDDYIGKVLKTDKNNIVIYIHGGLNTSNDSIERANLLSKLMANDIEPSLKENIDENDKGYHGIFIHWRSGLLTTYKDHVFNQRAGEYWPTIGVLTSPFVVIQDIARGLSRTPMIWLHKFNSWEKGASFNGCDTSTLTPGERNAIHIGCDLIKEHPFGELIVPDNNSDTRSGWAKFGQGTLGGVQTLAGFITAPVFDAVGTGAWNVMNQRTEIMFNKIKPYDLSYQSLDEYSHIREGALSRFLDYLAKCDHTKTKNIILVGHSMGAIVANKILNQYPNIHFKRIIYMGAASSIKDFQASVIPYMKLEANKETKFYNYMLHPAAENLESHGFGGTGSLLNQIDHFYETPVFENHRTLGKWVNVLNGINFFRANDIEDRFYLRTFPFDSAYPTLHGEFDDAKFSCWQNRGFWSENFGLPMKDENLKINQACIDAKITPIQSKDY